MLKMTRAKNHNESLAESQRLDIAQAASRHLPARDQAARRTIRHGSYARAFGLDAKSAFLKRTPTQARGDQSVRRILESCEELLGEMPFEQITVDSIASRARVPASSMYFFFQDRLSIFFRLIEVALDQIGDEYVLTDEDAAEPLLSYVRRLEGRLATIWTKHKNMLDLFFSYRVHPSVSEMVVRLQGHVDGQLARRLKHDFPRMATKRRRALARVINGNLMQGLDIASAMPSQSVQAFKAEWSTMLHQYLRGLGAS
jgi:AcrR family transcriptional regulator